MDGDGLICAWQLDGKGGGRPLTWDEIDGVSPQAEAPAWVHLQRDHPRAIAWLREGSGLPALVSDALLAEETRPRAVFFPDGALINLRGVNLNPGAEPDDMVSLRLWIDDRRVVSVRQRRLRAVDDLRAHLEAGHGAPTSSGELMVHLALSLSVRMAPVIETLKDAVDDLEENLVDGAAPSFGLRSQLATLRRQTIVLKRYIAPQREALSRVSVERPAWLPDTVRGRLHEAADAVTRYVEDLDALRERAAVIQDEIATGLSMRMDRTIYVLSLVAAVFLPLGLLTGLLGINVGGIPGAETPWAFAVVTILLLVIAGVEIWLLRRLRWL